MSKFLKLLFLIFPILILIGVLHLNIKSYRSIHFKDGVNQDVLHQLHFLREKMHQGEANQMQQLFPEGFVFLNALYGLTWAELINNQTHSSRLYQEGIKEINWTIKQIQSNAGKIIFPENIVPKYGAFYNGWNNYLIARKLALQTTEERNENEVKQFQFICDQLYYAFQSVHSRTPYLESYKAQTWPADNLVCIAALSWHDKLFPPKYTDFINDWLHHVQQKLDPKTDLIPHSVSPLTGNTKERARGSSQSLMNNFLLEIDSNFAKQQFKIYKSLFLDYRFGLPGIREYPKGEKGNGDIDSGPVLLGIGGAASIVGMRTMIRNNELAAYQGLSNSIDGFGLAYSLNDEKKYLFGTLPMADAFIAWGNVGIQKNQQKKIKNWRWYFHFLSILIIAFCLMLIKWILKKRS